MRDGDPHKLVPIREMFERFTTLFAIIAIELDDRKRTLLTIDLLNKVDELKDIMSKADD